MKIINFSEEKKVIEVDRIFKKAVSQMKEIGFSKNDMNNLKDDLEKIDKGLTVRLYISPYLRLELRHYGILIAKELF